MGLATLTTFAEVTTLAHGHGGPGWELGTCLWSPAVTSAGQDRYAIMREPVPGDTVFHWVAGIEPSRPRRRFLWGASRVAEKVKITNQEPPQATPWEGRGHYYRIELSEFTPLAPPPRLDQIEQELAGTILYDLEADRPKHYPYVRYRDAFRIAQGIYLTKLSTNLAEALSSVSSSILHSVDKVSPREIASEYDEGERLKREIALFRRNPALRRAAIAMHGYSCVACGFNFGNAYGELGEGFIELHHLVPLSERQDAASKQMLKTRVVDVVPLCANCHRVVHRERPATPVERLRAAIHKG